MAEIEVDKGLTLFERDRRAIRAMAQTGTQAMTRRYLKVLSGRTLP